MSNSSRDAILMRLRRQAIPSVSEPNWSSDAWVRYSDTVGQLKSMLEFVGGSLFEVGTLEEVMQRLQTFEEWRSAQRVLSRVDGIAGSVPPDEAATPHELENLDFVVARGRLAVAENAAVWVDDLQVRHRVSYFITQFLVLIVERQHIVSNMHEAYQRLPNPLPTFGCFISGPSKTADIEQSLVIGAHGCRSLQLYVLG